MTSKIFVEKIELPAGSSESSITLNSGIDVETLTNDAIVNDSKTVGVAGKNSMLVGPLTMNSVFTVAGSLTIV
jgi:hypothetical protein